MDSFQLNKIIGAVLGTLLFVMGIGFLAEALYHPIEGRGPGYTLPEPAESEGGEIEPEVEAMPIGMMMAGSDAGEGAGAARKCGSCHTFEQGGGHPQGPNLYDIVGRPVAGVQDFEYSPAMVEHAAIAPEWTYEELNAFLLAPKVHVPGTKMNFNGVPDDEERADIIAYLSTLSASPVPFPPVEDPVVQPEEATEPAEGAVESEGEAPVVESNETAPMETPVEGTPTGTNTPAGGTQEVNPAAEGIELPEGVEPPQGEAPTESANDGNQAGEQAPEPAVMTPAPEGSAQPLPMTAPAQ